MTRPMAWPKLNRASRCAVCQRRVRGHAWAERVAGGKVIALCYTHQPRARGAAS
jgi:hypothetical protein